MTIDAARIASNLDDVRCRIAAACARCGRDVATVRLVAISKTQPIAAIEAAYAAGARVFGENYAQELVEKHDALTGLAGVEWHFVGHLQTNKARVVAERATMVHSIDGVRLAREIGKRAVAVGRVVDVLCEVNVAGEASKDGVAPAELAPLLDALETIDGVRLRGLMAIPPPTDTAEDARRFHATLRTLRDQHGGAHRLPELSTGMTHDFEVAIEEGATIVRVGTGLFGLRAPRP